MEISRIHFLDRTEVNICRGNDTVFLDQACTQTSLIVLQVCRTDDNISGLDNIVGVETFGQ